MLTGNTLIFHDELISSKDHPLLLNPPYNLTLPISELITPKDKDNRNDGVNNKKKKDQDDNIPRPHNAFILFRIDYAARLKNSNNDQKVSIRIVSQLASKQWRKESEEVKLFFKVLADLYQERHKALYPCYKYTPKKPGSPYQVKKAKLSKKNDDFKKKNKECMITWYVHDNFEDEDSRSEKDSRDNFIVPNYPPQRNIQPTITQPSQTDLQQIPATFINYTAYPSASTLAFHSTTTTALLTYDRFSVEADTNNNNNNNSINNNNNNSQTSPPSSPSSSSSSLPPSSSSPSHHPSSSQSSDSFYWTGPEMQSNLTLLDFDSSPFFFN